MNKQLSLEGQTCKSNKDIIARKRIKTVDEYQFTSTSMEEQNVEPHSSNTGEKPLYNYNLKINIVVKGYIFIAFI